MGGIPILAEVKVEHESQMDIDKLTRKFINIGRSAQSAFTSTYEKINSRETSHQTLRRASKLCVSESEKQQAIDALGGLLYNRVFADAGINRLMNPQLIGQFPALPAKALLASAEETIGEHFTNGNKRKMLEVVRGMSMFKDFLNPKRKPQPSKTQKKILG